jgi:hypothetical protein
VQQAGMHQRRVVHGDVLALGDRQRVAQRAGTVVDDRGGTRPIQQRQRLRGRRHLVDHFQQPRRMHIFYGLVCLRHPCSLTVRRLRISDLSGMQGQSVQASRRPRPHAYLMDNLSHMRITGLPRRSRRAPPASRS